MDPQRFPNKEDIEGNGEMLTVASIGIILTIHLNVYTSALSYRTIIKTA